MSISWIVSFTTGGGFGAGGSVPENPEMQSGLGLGVGRVTFWICTEINISFDLDVSGASSLLRLQVSFLESKVKNLHGW